MKHHSYGTWTDLGADQNDVAICLRTTIPATITSCNSTGTEINFFALGERVYVKGSGLDANSDYNILIQDDPVIGGELLDEEEIPANATLTEVPTDENGNFVPTLIWAIPADIPITYNRYDIVVDKLGEGGNTGKLNFASDGIDSISAAGIVAPIPEEQTLVLFSIGVLMLAGYVIVRRRYS